MENSGYTTFIPNSSLGESAATQKEATNMTQITTTGNNSETRVNVEIDISESAAFTLISLITANLLESIETMDDDTFDEISRVSRALQQEVY